MYTAAAELACVYYTGCVYIMLSGTAPNSCGSRALSNSRIFSSAAGGRLAGFFRIPSRSPLSLERIVYSTVLCVILFVYVCIYVQHTYTL